MQYLRQIAQRGKNQVWVKSQLIDFIRLQKPNFREKSQKSELAKVLKVGKGYDNKAAAMLRDFFLGAREDRRGCGRSVADGGAFWGRGSTPEP